MTEALVWGIVVGGIAAFAVLVSATVAVWRMTRAHERLEGHWARIESHLAEIARRAAGGDGRAS